MAKRFLSMVAGLVLCMSGAAAAQIHKQVGITGGLSIFSETDKIGPLTATHESKTGAVAGVVLDISLLNILSIEPGLLYSARGTEFSNVFVEKAPDGHINYSYLAIPVHAKLRWIGIPMVCPYALAGINMGFLLSATSKYGSRTNDFSSDVNTLDFGLDFGAGMEFNLPSIVPYLEYVYDAGLSTIAKNAPSDESAALSGSEIKVGVRFKL